MQAGEVWGGVLCAGGAGGGLGGFGWDVEVDDLLEGSIEVLPEVAGFGGEALERDAVVPRFGFNDVDYIVAFLFEQVHTCNQTKKNYGSKLHEEPFSQTITFRTTQKEAISRAKSFRKIFVVCKIDTVNRVGISNLAKLFITITAIPISNVFLTNSAVLTIAVGHVIQLFK